MLPAKPTPLGSDVPAGLVNHADFEEFQAFLDMREQQRDTTYKHVHKLNLLANRALFHVHRGDLPLVAGLQAEYRTRATEAIAPIADTVEVRRLLESCNETYIAGVIFVHFLDHGRLPTKEEVPVAIDGTEYLSGVCGFLRELQRYAAARAVERDVPSVLLCRDVIDAVHSQLMLFDFRNSPLRRKYDGVKYAVKALEDILYDLSLTQFEEAAPLREGRGAGQPPEALLDVAQFETLRKDMEAYDATRDTIIRRSRDITKSAKNAIYSLHRGDTKKADQQLRDAEAVAKELLPLVADRTLRFNSLADGLEEYAEACAFRHFLLDGGGVLPKAALPLLEVPEYLGGLVDLTGEIGRYAVAQATRRDVAAVQRCRAVLDALAGEMLSLRLPASLNKKGDSLNTNLRKIERLQYDLMLAAGGKRPTPPDPNPPAAAAAGAIDETE